MLPPELLTDIIVWLPAPELFALRVVCRTLHSVAVADSLWQMLLTQHADTFLLIPAETRPSPPERACAHFFALAHALRRVAATELNRERQINLPQVSRTTYNMLLASTKAYFEQPNVSFPSLLREQWAHVLQVLPGLGLGSFQEFNYEGADGGAVFAHMAPALHGESSVRIQLLPWTDGGRESVSLVRSVAMSEPDPIPDDHLFSCTECQGDHDDELLMLCDLCYAAYHTYCIGLAKVPAGDWYCPRCVAEHRSAVCRGATYRFKFHVPEREEAVGAASTEGDASAPPAGLASVAVGVWSPSSYVLFQCVSANASRAMGECEPVHISCKVFAATLRAPGVHTHARQCDMDLPDSSGRSGIDHTWSLVSRMAGSTSTSGGP